MLFFQASSSTAASLALVFTISYIYVGFVPRHVDTQHFSFRILSVGRKSTRQSENTTSRPLSRVASRFSKSKTNENKHRHTNTHTNTQQNSNNHLNAKQTAKRLAVAVKVTVFVILRLQRNCFLSRLTFNIFILLENIHLLDMKNRCS